MKVPEGLWRVSRAAPREKALPWDTVSIAHRTLPLASRGRVCCEGMRAGLPSRAVGINGIAAIWSAGGWFAAGRRPSGNSSDAGGRRFEQQHAAAEQRRRACRQQEDGQLRGDLTASRKMARGHAAEGILAAFCDRPGCYEPCRDSCRCQARYCGDDCRQAMRRVRDRERKHLGRKTISGRLKRRLEYQARRAATTSSSAADSCQATELRWPRCPGAGRRLSEPGWLGLIFGGS